MSEIGDVTSHGHRGGRGRRLLINLVWALGGVLLSVFLLADPLGVHSLDSWSQRLLSRGPATQPAADSAELWTVSLLKHILKKTLPD